MSRARGRPGAGPRRLAELLAALPVTIETIAVQAFAVRTPDYPGGLRPTGLVTLGGLGSVGRGEHVAFDADEQGRFALEAPALLLDHRGPVGALLAALDPAAPSVSAWRRSALEGALIDLALRQRSDDPARQTLAALIDDAAIAASGDGTLRFVVSFEACAAPADRLRSLAARFPGAGFKVDVDPGWSAAAIDALAAAGPVEVLDFKARGDGPGATRIAARFASARIEDPPFGAAIDPRRVIRDASLGSVADVARAVADGHGVNVKAPRMGGFLAALEGLGVALDGGAPAYWGGMFEVGVGRRQARQLASLFTARAGNDLAPVGAVDRPPVDGDTIHARATLPGFGS